MLLLSRPNDLIVFDVNCYYDRSIENSLDPAHNEFVHPTQGFAGTRADYRVDDFDVEDWPLGVRFWYQFESSAKKEELGQKTRSFDSQTKAGSGTHGPNTLITHIHLTAEKWFH